MKIALYISVAAMALVSSPNLLAQSADDTAATTASTAGFAMSASQKTQYDAWPADRKAKYDAWPADYRRYFWSLTDPRKIGWWALSDTQRKQVLDLPPGDRENTWHSIEAQLAGAPPPAAAENPETAAAATAAPDAPGAVKAQANPPGEGVPSPVPPNPESASAPVPPAMPADPNYRAGPNQSALTPAPAQAMNKSYPLCSKTVQDSCINPSEARGSMKARRRHASG